MTYTADFDFVFGVTPEVRRAMREEQGIQDEHVNIVVFGLVSSGQTSFINSGRGLYPRFRAEYNFENQSLVLDLSATER
jgi:hypothetical protein